MQERTVIDLDEVMLLRGEEGRPAGESPTALADSGVWEWDEWVRANEAMKALRVPDSVVKAEKKKSVRQYYEETNEIIDARIDAHKIIMGRAGEGEDEGAAERGRCVLNTSKAAASISFIVNVCLVVTKVIAVSLTGSISVISSLVDSGLDLFSGLVLYLADRAVSKVNPYDFPVGKSRYEPIAVVVIACVMGTAALQVIFESITRLVNHSGKASMHAERGVLAPWFFSLERLFRFFRCVTAAILFFLRSGAGRGHDDI